MAVERRVQRNFPVLDHFRWVSAFLVLISHARNMLMVDHDSLVAPSVFSKVIYGISGLGHVAVVSFLSSAAS